MNLPSRVRRLERRTSRVPPQCPSCGGPNPGHDAYVICDLDGNRFEPACPRCGLTVDASGRSRGAMAGAQTREGRTVEVLMESPPTI
jgi:tRNA(Ile2) C34 agmatinyltransferase TiaS